MTKRILHIAILLTASLLANQSMAASFDCKKAASATEKMICADGSLSSLDDKLQKGYQTALDAVKPSVKQKLVTEQRNWIKYVRDICTDVSCLSKAYLARIDLLSKTEGYIVNDSECSIPDGTSCRSVLYYRDPGYRVASFNKSLASNKRSARVIGCDRLIDLPVGYANSNDSFGGYCTILDGSTRSRVMICDDDMIGHFAMQSFKENEDTDQNLIDFTNEHCFGG
ncbi:lysozyme inhibitor LprI family protein [Dyella koreensis]|uniref:DUF1311 domain-containing protein n=1 Tax=Dyella koreensis TaxID=311235 RepID=A0ABW8K2R0_9GAMM